MNIWMISSLTFPENTKPETTSSLAPEDSVRELVREDHQHSTTKAQQLPGLEANQRLEEPHLGPMTPSRRKPEIRILKWDHSGVLSKEHTKLGPKGPGQGTSLR